MSIFFKKKKMQIQMAIGNRQNMLPNIPRIAKESQYFKHKRIPNNLNYLTMHILLKCNETDLFAVEDTEMVSGIFSNV